MKIQFCLLLFFAGVISIHAQNVMHPDWVKIVNGPTTFDAEGWGLDIDSQGHLYWPVNSDSLGQGLDIICYKFDEDGNELWDQALILGGPGTQQGYVCNSDTDVLYIAGRRCPFLINSCDMYVAKINKQNGTVIWERDLGFSANWYEEVDGLEIIGDEIYCGGWAQELEPGLYFTDMGLWKLDTDGNTQWSNYLGEVGTAEHLDGHFVVDENFIYGAGLWNGGFGANLYNGYSFLGKFSKEDGSLIDSTLFGYQSNQALDIENALGMTTDGTHLYITGYTTPTVFNDWQIFVAKFDKDLNQIWFRDWGGDGTESARGIVVHDGVIYVAGLTETASLSSGGHDGLLLKYDLDGNFLSFETWGGEVNDAFHDLVIYNDHIYITGFTETPDEEKSAFLIKLFDQLVSSNELTLADEKLFDVFPNPSFGEVKLKLNNNFNVPGTIELCDLKGNVLETIDMDPSKLEVNIFLPAAGAYIFKYTVNGKYWNERVVRLN